MAKTFWSVNIHCTFSSKECLPMLNPEPREWREVKEDLGDLSPRNLVGRGSVRAGDNAKSTARTERASRNILSNDWVKKKTLNYY
jgi:hypothetical protein